MVHRGEEQAEKDGAVSEAWISPLEDTGYLESQNLLVKWPQVVCIDLYWFCRLCSCKNLSILVCIYRSVLILTNVGNGCASYIICGAHKMCVKNSLWFQLYLDLERKGCQMQARKKLHPQLNGYNSWVWNLNDLNGYLCNKTHILLNNL